MRGAGSGRGLAVALSAVALAGCAGGPPARTPSGEPVYVVSNNWHSGIVLETRAIPPGRWPQSARFHGYRYLEVGWGDRDAYLAPRTTPQLALRAAFVSRGSALMISGFDEPVSRRYQGLDVVELRLSPRALGGLARFIEASHAEDAGGQPVPLPSGWGGAGAFFYLARGRFHALNTCNSWTARALRAAGLPLVPGLTLTAYHLRQQILPLGRLHPGEPG